MSTTILSPHCPLAWELERTLRKSWVDAFSDPAFLADIAKFTGIPTILQEGAEGQEVLRAVSKSFAENQPRFKELQTKFFNKYL